VIAPTDVPSAAPAPTVVPRATPGSKADFTVVAVGDSIPMNGAQICPGCTGFVDRYADALASATGRTVEVRNLSQGGLDVGVLLKELGGWSERASALADADAIIVGIAHNDVPWAVSDDACDGDGGDDPDWSTYTDACLVTEVRRYTPTYKAVFERIAALRAGEPTILRTINRYNEWIGRPGRALVPAGVTMTVTTIEAWNKMICGAAEANGFVCADISTAFNGTDGLRPSGELLASDYVHPSDKGNAVIADVLTGLGFEPLVP
jgi:lysophospholipase L1-like esterase